MSDRLLIYFCCIVYFRRQIYICETNELSYSRLHLIDNATLSYQVEHDPCSASRNKSTSWKSRCSYRSRSSDFHELHNFDYAAALLLQKLITISTNHPLESYERRNFRFMRVHYIQRGGVFNSPSRAIVSYKDTRNCVSISGSKYQRAVSINLLDLVFGRDS